MRKREVLLAQPPEFFKELCGGRVPSLQEKLHCVELSVQRLNSLNRYENDTYVVEVTSKPPFIHLDISRHDGQPCKSWKELQQIKNELVGPECEAVELFPAESRLVDTANQYHLWVYADPKFRFPFGFAHRFVLGTPLQMPGTTNTVKVDGVTAPRQTSLTPQAA